MKKFILGMLSAVALAAPAAAADLPMRAAPAPIPAPIWTWTGFYLGGNIGAAWTSNRIEERIFGATWGRSSDARFIGGGQIGYNWQFNQFVLGIEGDIDGIANRSRATIVTLPVVGPITASGNSDANWVSTIAARFGFAVDRALFYGKAGYGWVNGGGNVILTNAAGATVAIGGSGTRGGWLLGGGIEYAIAHNWTIKGEFDYLGTGRSRTFVVPAGAPFLVGDTFTTNGRNVSMVKFGFNYLFH